MQPSNACARSGRRALVVPDAFFDGSAASTIATLAARHATTRNLFGRVTMLEAGGLMSYGTNLADHIVRPASISVASSKAQKPADLPVMQPTKFELVINLKTAKALGLDVPPTLLARADEVIE